MTETPTPEPKVFNPPTLEECHKFAVAIGLTKEEGERFFYHHDARGWLLGRAKMKSWKSALHTWRLNQSKWNVAKVEKPLPMELFIRKEELTRVEEKIRLIRGSYSENMDYTPEDRVKMRSLHQRRKELLRILGMHA